MTSVTSVLIVSLLQGAAPAPKATDIVHGALSYIVSKGCHGAREGATDFLAWPALTYGAGRPPAWGETKFIKCYPGVWSTSESLGAGAYWALNDHAEIEANPNATLLNQEKNYAAFKKVFGWQLTNHGTLAPNAFIKYDAKKLKRLFELIYVRPDDAVGTATGQQIYDRVFKDSITRFARDAAFIKTAVPKAEQAQMLKDYQAAAKKMGAAFVGHQWLKDVAAKALPQDQEPASARTGRTLGVILRRMADGTWPTVVTLLKQVIADYDPELYAEVGGKL